MKSTLAASIALMFSLSLTSSILGIVGIVGASSMSSASYSVDSDTLSGGGGEFTSTSYRVNGSVGQSVAGEASSASYSQLAGFWHTIEEILAALISTDKSTYTTGETQTVYVGLSNPGAQTTVDAYVAVMLQDGSLFFVEYDINTGLYSFHPGTVDSATWTPCVTGLALPADYDLSNFALLQYIFGGGEPEGDYAWYIALTNPGTTNIVGHMGSSGFSFTP